MTKSSLPGPVRWLGRIFAQYPLAMIVFVGAPSGIAADLLSVPLAYVLGPMAVWLIMSLMGLRYAPTRGRLANLSRVGLGVFIGTQISPDIVDKGTEYALSVLLVIPYSLMVVVVAAPIVMKLSNLSRNTVLCSVAPGGLLGLVMYAEELKANVAAVALLHSLRLFLVVMSIPVIYVLIFHNEPMSMSDDAFTMKGWSVETMAWLIGSGALGYFLGPKLRLPAGVLTGPILVSGILHGTGVWPEPLPTLLVIVMQIVFGTMIGSQFFGMNVRFFRRLVGVGFVIMLIAVGLAVPFAWLGSQIADVEFITALMAFSPGGVAEASLVTIAVGGDVAYVAVHHMMRVVVVLAIAPLVIKTMQRIRPIPPEDEDGPTR